jgi:hypothetical protein
MRSTFRTALVLSALGASVLAASACADDDSETVVVPPTEPPIDPPPQDEPLFPAPGGMRRLLARQYVASVRVLLGDEAAEVADPPDDQPLFGLDAIGASELPLTASGVEKYERSARLVAGAAVDTAATYDALVPCTPAGLDDEACLATVVSAFGLRAWRRPLTQQEIDEIVDVGLVSADEYQSFESGVEAAVSSMLQSPHFLYIIELGEPVEGEDGIFKLTSYEVATRMSMFLVGHTPDDTLLDDAAAGDLDSADGIRAAATRLVAQPAARDALRGFYDELLRLRDIGGVTKDAELFPNFDDDTRAALREETLRLIDDIVWERDADAFELFDAPYTYVNEDNAWLYGLSADGPGYEKVTVPHRFGVLTQGSVLSLLAQPTRTSPTRRGLFIQNAFLCQEVKPPPPDVNPTLPDDIGTDMTMKQRLEAHRNNPTCAGCHNFMDPLGLALENFNSIGVYRERDAGQDIDPSGEVPAFGSFETLEDMVALIKDHEKTAGCMVRQLYRQSIGRREREGQYDALDDIAEQFTSDGHSIQTLLVDLVASEPFTLVSTPE